MKGLIIALLVLLLITYCLCDLLSVKFGKAIPISYCVLVLIQYAAALSGRLSNFKYILFVSLGVCVVFLVFKYHKNLKGLYNKNFFSISLIVFILIFIYLHFNLSNVYIQNIDDLGYWSTRLDDMFRNDSLYTTENYVVYPGKAYPPFTHLLEFGLSKLLGGLNDHNIIFALSSFTCSLFMFVFDKFDFNLDDIFKAIITAAGIIVLMLCVSLNPTNNNPSYIFNSIYVDWVLSAVMMYGFYHIYKFKYDELSSYICVGVASFVLIFTKQIGLALALLLNVTLLVKIILDRELSIKNIFRYIALCIVIPFAIYYSWNLYANLVFSVGDNAVSSSLPIDGSFVSGGFSNVDKIKSIIDFFIFSIYEPVMTNPINLSYFAIILFVTTILVIYGIMNKEKISYYTIPLFFFLGSVGYALGIKLSYMALFTDGETNPLFGRYMQTYTYFGFLLVFIMMYEKLNKKSFLCLILFINCIFVNVDSIDTFLYKNNREIFRKEEREAIKEWIDNEYNYQYIAVINQTDMRYKNLMVKLFGDKGENVSYKQFTVYDDLDDLKELLKNNEYIIICDSDDYFNGLWAKITDLPPYNSTLYRIISDGYAIRLEMMYIWEPNN